MTTGTTKSERTKSALSHAAVELFAEKGFEDTTVDEIAARAGVSRRTFFRHFPSKSDAAMHHWDVWLEAVKQGLAQQPTAEAVLDSIAIVLDNSASIFLGPGDFVLKLMKVIKRTPALRRHPRAFVDRYTRVIAKFIKTRLPGSPNVLAEIIAAAIMAAVMHAQWDWVESNGEKDLTKNFSASFGLLKRAFGPLLPSNSHQGTHDPTVIVISPGQTNDAELIAKLQGVFKSS